MNSLFCWGCRLQAEYLETKPWTHTPNLPCINSPGWWWWCNRAGDVLFSHSGPLINQLCFKRCSQFVADHMHLFMTTIYLLLMATSCMIMNHGTKRYWVKWTSVASPVTRCASSSTQGNWCNRVNTEQNLKGTVPTSRDLQDVINTVSTQY